MLTRSFSLLGLLLATVVVAAAEDRVTGRSGLIAVRTSDSAWKILRPGDALPVIAEWQIAPAQVARIGVAGGVIVLSAESEGMWNLKDRSLTVKRGRANVQLLHTAADVIVAGQPSDQTWRVSAGAEMIFTADEGQHFSVLTGEMRPDNENAKAIMAPAIVQVDKGGKSSVIAPTDADWAARERRWTMNSQGLGQLIAKDSQSGNQVRLEVARYHVNVVLHPPVALVQIDQSFYNPYARQEEGTFVFNLPQGASVSRFAMFVTPEQLIEGELIDRKRADEVYTTIVRSKRDPAILEQIGDNLFRMRVFPVFARDTKRILLDYTVPLLAEQGRYQFELPLLSDLKPIWDFGIRGTVYPPFAPGTLSIPTHPMIPVTPGNDGRMTFQYAARDVQPPPSLLVDYAADSQRQPTARAFTVDKSAQHYVATLPAAAHPIAKEHAQPADVLVVMDTSGSGGDLQPFRRAARTVLRHLRPTDRVQLGCSDYAYRALTTDWVKVDENAIDDLVHKLDDEFALGASDLGPNLRMGAGNAFAQSPPDRRRLLVYIGDGISTFSSDRAIWNAPAFRDPAARPAVCLLRVGATRTEQSWLIDIVRETHGRLFDLDASVKAWNDLFQWTIAGLPTEPLQVAVTENGRASNDDLFVTPDWIPGQELHVFGRCPPQDRLQLSVQVAGQPVQKYDLPLPDGDAEEAVFTGRLWAQRKLEHLLRTPVKDDRAHHEQVVALCQEWSLMSPKTAFLVLETESDYDRWKIDRRKRHRYWSPPESITALPLPASIRTKLPADGPTTSQPLAVSQSNRGRQRMVTRAMERARAALAERDPIQAHLALLSVRDWALSGVPEGFQELQVQVAQQLQRESALRELGLARPTVDPHAIPAWPQASLLLPFLASGGLSTDYLERNPHALKLLQPLTLPPNMKLSDLAAEVKKQLGLPVIIQTTALVDEGVDLTADLDADALQGITAKSQLHHLLSPLQLIAVPEKHFLRITTIAHADELHVTKVYPVGDLIHHDLLPPPFRLSNPFFDHREWKRRQIESRLQQPMTVEFDDVPLQLVFEWMAKKLDQPIRLDLPALQDEGIDPKSRVTLHLADVPAEVILDEVLKQFHLTNVIDHEVLTLTTQAKADEVLETRLYSAAGLLDGLQPHPLREPHGADGGFSYQRGGGGGGFFGGGGMGGWSGNNVGGLGGFIGRNDGGSGNGLPPGQSGFGEIAPPHVESDDDDLTPDDTAMPEPDFGSPGQAMSPSASDALSLIQSQSSGQWEQVDGVGGTMMYYEPSLSLVLRNTKRVHRETAELLAKLRREAERDPSAALRRPRLRRDGPLAARLPDFANLMSLLQEMTSGQWSQIDGTGGDQTPHSLGLALAVRQTSPTHEEIEDLLTMLRRSRYLAESLATRDTLEGIDDGLFLLDQTALTQLPRGVRSSANADEVAKALQALSIRKPANELQQQWRRTAPNQPPLEVNLRKAGAGLEIQLLDRAFRVEGSRSAVAYPGIGLVEIDAWGEAVRQLTDATLPWLPHRTNEELAQLFDVAIEHHTVGEVSLRLRTRTATGISVLATFSTTTGQPTAWAVYHDQELQFRLDFTPKVITSFDAEGKAFGRWELKVDGPSTAINAVNDWPGSVIVDLANPEDLFTKVRQAIARQDYHAALSAVDKLSSNVSDQPLLHFLRAWLRELSERPNEALVESQRHSLQLVLKSSATDLVRWFNPSFFAALGASGLLKLIQEVPDEQRSVVHWDQLAELAITARQPKVALKAATRALSMQPDPQGVVARRTLRIELLLRLGEFATARELGLTCLAERPPVASLCEIGDLFHRFEHPAVGHELYAAVSARDDLTAEERVEILLREAQWLKGPARWERLLEAEDKLAEGDRHRGLALQTIIDEAQYPDDAQPLERLAQRTQRPNSQRWLRIRQAQIVGDPQTAAQIAFALYQKQAMPADRTDWMLRLMLTARRHTEIVAILEPRLRRGEKLTESSLQVLSTAYRALNRTSDVFRAETHSRDVTSMPDTPPTSSPRGKRLPGGFGGGFP